MEPFYDLRLFTVEELYSRFFTGRFPTGSADKSFFLLFEFSNFKTTQLDFTSHTKGFFDVTITAKSTLKQFELRVFCNKQKPDGYLTLPFNINKNKILSLREDTSDILTVMNDLLLPYERLNTSKIFCSEDIFYRTLFYFLDVQSKIDFVSLLSIDSILCELRDHSDMPYIHCKSVFNGEVVEFGSSTGSLHTKSLNDNWQTIFRTYFALLDQEQTQRFSYLYLHYEKNSQFNRYFLCLCIHQLLKMKETQMKILFNPQPYKPFLSYSDRASCRSLVDGSFLDYFFG